jgi:hypothetical protein
MGGSQKGVGMGEKSEASVIVVGCRGILQGIVGRGREEVGSSRGTATPVECGVSSTKARGSKEDGVIIVEVDKHMVNKDSQDNKDNRDKDKGWGLQMRGESLGVKEE